MTSYKAGMIRNAYLAMTTQEVQASINDQSLHYVTEDICRVYALYFALLRFSIAAHATPIPIKSIVPGSGVAVGEFSPGFTNSADYAISTPSGTSLL